MIPGGSPYSVEFGFDGNQYFHRVTLLGEGAVYPTHAHSYDHDTAIEGEIWLVDESGEKELHVGTEENPKRFVIPAGKPHGFIAKSEVARFTCTHTLRAEDGMPLGFDESKERLFQATCRL